MRVYTDGKEIPLSIYNAAYLNFNYQPSDYEIKDFQADNALLPLNISSKQRYDTLKIQIMFRNAKLSDISGFAEKLKKCEIQIDNNFLTAKTFACTLKSSDLKKQSSKIYTVTYTFNCFVFGQTHTLTLNDSSNSFEIHGAKETEAVISVENKTASILSSVKILDFSIDQLSAGEKIIIDGEKKTVTSNGENAFDRVEFFTFPRFMPGIHDITVPLGFEATITYRERF